VGGRLTAAPVAPRVVQAALVVLGLVSLAVPVPAAAQTSPEPSPSGDGTPPVEVPPAVPGEEVCTPTDGQLVALSGLVALDESTYVVLNDGRLGNGVFFLDQNCQTTGEQIFLPDHGGIIADAEDLAYDWEAGVLWVADIGDNNAERPHVVLYRIDLDDRVPVIYRFTYPDGPRNAEALVLDGDGTPIIVSKEIGTAGLYRPTGELVPSQSFDDTIPLERVGEFSPVDTGTGHPVGPPARMVVTGGANAPDGSRVALRTLTDAYEFDVTDGDVVGAITSGRFRITPLPDEPQGEAIAYTPDGRYFLTVSDTLDHPEDVVPVILRYTPTEPAPEPTSTPEAQAPAPAERSRSLLDRLGPQGILNIVAAIGVVGLLMVITGIVGIVRARRAAAGEPDDGEPDGDGSTPAPAPATGRARVTPPPDPQPGWEPDLGTAQGYDGQAAPYGGHPQGVPPGTAPPAGPPRSGGTVYTAGSSNRADQVFDQDHPDGYPDDRAAYPNRQDGMTPPGVYRAQSAASPGGTYTGGVYQSNPDDVPDYYSDDPDYPYEFRERDTW
jgi:hypothetical protein